MFHYISSLPSAEWETLRPRRVALLGSTGSIGVNSLRVIASCPDLFEVTALAGGRNIHLLAEQARQWRPPYLGVLNETLKSPLKDLLPSNYTPEILAGPEGYATLAALPEVSTVLSAQVGAAGLRATWAAALAGKVICLANKESLVLAGDLLREICAATGAVILPVDSEHNAVFQALHGRNPETIRKIILTASGGPFRGKTREYLKTVTPEQALKHPNWNMGAKITIDSATMMNKGLEIIEAWHLYALPVHAIEVWVHPQSVVHSLAEFTDGSLMAQMGTPDMRLPIAHCLAWPQMADTGVAVLGLDRVATLTFEEPDLHSFPCLRLAKQVLEAGATGHAVTLNAANEIAVDAFLHGLIGFTDIPDVIAEALDAHATPPPRTLEAIEELDLITRHQVGIRIKSE